MQNSNWNSVVVILLVLVGDFRDKSKVGLLALLSLSLHLWSRDFFLKNLFALAISSCASYKSRFFGLSIACTLAVTGAVIVTQSKKSANFFRLPPQTILDFILRIWQFPALFGGPYRSF